MSCAPEDENAPRFFRFKRHIAPEQQAALEKQFFARGATKLEPRPCPPFELLDYCRATMHRAKSPRTASELVDEWFREWRGHNLKPANVGKKYKAAHVDRAAKWLDRHEKQGRLCVVDNAGKWNAKRYLQVPEADWRRRRTQRSKSSEKTSEQ